MCVEGTSSLLSRMPGSFLSSKSQPRFQKAVQSRCKGKRPAFLTELHLRVATSGSIKVREMKEFDW